MLGRYIYIYVLSVGLTEQHMTGTSVANCVFKLFSYSVLNCRNMQKRTIKHEDISHIDSYM